MVNKKRERQNYMKTLNKIVSGLKDDFRFVMESAADLRRGLFPTQEEERMDVYWLAYNTGYGDAHDFATGHWNFLANRAEHLFDSGFEFAGYLAGIQDGMESAHDNFVNLGMIEPKPEGE